MEQLLVLFSLCSLIIAMELVTLQALIPTIPNTSLRLENISVSYICTNLHILVELDLYRFLQCLYVILNHSKVYFIYLLNRNMLLQFFYFILDAKLLN